ncbi:phosphate ABC transporter substrate-binding protein PstS family protein [Hathewaya histolytica]|uniref:Phosphate-binding protein n=1 Tax=Hathewaya histolytica TaxID=1498 RepID=A0A4U9RES3_HATHI|nr:phosphate ABC transporter substrate-binding protein PstS family protein [Hathewaya histolytica]VTQ90294.1 phosphate ABC transporter substrate-binding protein [Hathewaya histolytica]
MKRKGINLLIGLLSISMVIGLFTGCGNGKKTSESIKEKSKNEEKIQKITGTITALGSSALQPLVEQSARNFKIKNPKATINVQGGGSGSGINQVADGNCDIGNSDVPAEAKLKNKSKLNELKDHKVCAIGFAMVVSKDVKIDSLTKEQIQKIFEGKVTNWNQLGGENKPINIINRGASSGTRATFIDTIMKGKKEKNGLGTTQDSSGAVRTALKSTDGGVSYLALSYLTDTVKEDMKVIKIDGVEANNENIINKKYPFWSYEHMYTKGEAKGVAKEFLEYMVSEENKYIIEKLGYIPMSNFK